SCSISSPATSIGAPPGHSHRTPRSLRSARRVSRTAWMASSVPRSDSSSTCRSNTPRIVPRNSARSSALNGYPPMCQRSNVRCSRVFATTPADTAPSSSASVAFLTGTPSSAACPPRRSWNSSPDQTRRSSWETRAPRERSRRSGAPAPAERGSCSPCRGVSEDGLQLQEFAQAGLAPLATVSGLLVTAEGAAEVGLRAVHVNVAAADPLGDLPGALDVRRRDVARQTIERVVGDLDRLVLVLVVDDGEHRAEDLLAGDGHVVADVGEDRGPDEVALLDALGPTGAAGHELRALFHALLDEALHLLELRLAGERADVDTVGRGVTDDHRLGGVLGGRDGLGHLRPRDQHARRRVARLAGVEDAALHARHDGRRDVGVVQDDV